MDTMNADADKAVIFDMDGVLVDSMDAHWRAWENVFAKRGVRISKKDFAETPGLRAKPAIRLLAGRDYDEPEMAAIVREQEEWAQFFLRENFPEMPGAGGLIRALDGAGWKMAVGTSGSAENIRLVFDRIGDARRIKTLVAAGDVSRGKPHPEVFLKCAEKLGISPSRAIVVEDSVVGLEAARAGGFKAAALTSTFPAERLRPLADLVVDSLRDLSPERLETLFMGC